MALTEAQKRASKKWNKKNKDKVVKIRLKSQTKNFIMNYAETEDINFIISLISEKYKKIEKNTCKTKE